MRPEILCVRFSRPVRGFLYQANTWIKNKEDEAGIVALKATDSATTIQRALENCIRATMLMAQTQPSTILVQQPRIFSTLHSWYLVLGCFKGQEVLGQKGSGGYILRVYCVPGS